MVKCVDSNTSISNTSITMDDATDTWLDAVGMPHGQYAERLRLGHSLVPLDGDHSNTAPANWVMVSGAEQAHIEAYNRAIGDLVASTGTPKMVEKVVYRDRTTKARGNGTNGQRAYERRVETGDTWSSIDVDIPNSLIMAKYYAKSRGLRWPPSVGNTSISNTSISK